MRFLPLVAALAMAACVTPAMSAGEIEGVDWHLVGLDGQEVDWNASLRLEGGTVSGKAPCNSYGGSNSATLPKVGFGAIRATRMACPDLAGETAFFEALQAMQRAELDQGHLFLIGPESRIMEFARTAGEPCLSCLARQ
jgi:heat shock protein HslJ